MSTDYHLEDSLERQKLKVFKSAFKHGLKNKNREACGIFVYENDFQDINFIPIDNLNHFNKNYFSINNEIFAKYYMNNQVISLYHTHIDYDECLSSIDIEISESLGLPSFVYSLLSKKFNLFYPISHVPYKLMDRAFIPLFQDCITFVKDYFFYELNIKLQTKIKNWSRPRNDYNENLTNIINNNFIELKKENVKLEKGDIFLYPPTTHSTMHLAVFDGEEKVYHHPVNSYPRKEFLYAGPLEKVYKLYRHKES
jgi:proteasome lid subunit RPN8/RPN11